MRTFDAGTPTCSAIPAATPAIRRWAVLRTSGGRGTGDPSSDPPEGFVVAVSTRRS